MQTGWYNPSHIPSRPLPRQNRPPTPNGSMRRALPGALAFAFAPASSSSSSSSLLRLRAAVASVRHLSRGGGGPPPRPTPPAVPPAYLAPTGSPHAYVARCAAAEAGIDPRSLLALGGKGTGPGTAPPPPSFADSTFQYVHPASFGRALPTFDVPEMAFLGRSNVGKSSLVNALTGGEEGPGPHLQEAREDAAGQLLRPGPVGPVRRRRRGGEES